MINRSITTDILSHLNKGKVIIITGARQTGKTTLARTIVERSGLKSKWFNADEPDERNWLTNPTSTELKKLFGDASLVVIDEAQRIPNIGITLKLAVENINNVQVIATGSSALELTGNINEPLTGRKREYVLYPFTFKELSEHTSEIEERRVLELRIIFGLYPEVINNQGNEKDVLYSLTDSYLFKDILSLEKVRKPALIEKILQALAFQVGSEVSFNEIGKTVGADNQTVERYIDLLQKVFAVFSLSSFSRNLRNELRKSRKIYFWDTGIRNTIIRNFNSLSMRSDSGALWESYLMAERMKYLRYSGNFVNSYFWRTAQQQEIDYIEVRDDQVNAFEYKWSEKENVRIPKTFLSAYPGSKIEIITRDNYAEFLTHI
jgi:uncharacterized protein